MTQLNLKPNNKMVLRAAVAAAFGVASMGANAVVNITAGTSTVKVASEIPSTTVALPNAGALLNIALTGQAGVAPSDTNPYYIRINLSGAAVFKTAAPGMICSGVTGAGAASATFSGALQAGGAGFNFVTFSFGNGVTAAGATGEVGSYITGLCTLTLNAAGVTGITAGVATTVTARTEYKDGASYVTAYLSDKAYISYAQGMSGAVSGSSALVVDATSGSDNFDSAQSDLTSQTLVRLGKYVATAIGNSAVTATLVGNASAGDIFSGISVTVSGATLAAGLAANGTSGVTLHNTATCTNQAYTVQSTANAGTTVTFTSVTTADIGSATGLVVCMNVSGGTQQISTGAVYVGSTGTFAANVTATLGGMKQLINITTNGQTKNAYIVHSPSSTAKTSQLWIKNTGSTAGAVYATCYNSAGTVVGTANSTLITSIAANELAKKTSSDVFTAIGYTGYTATEKFSCVLNGALAGMEMVNQTQDTTTGAITVTQAQTN